MNKIKKNTVKKKNLPVDSISSDVKKTGDEAIQYALNVVSSKLINYMSDYFWCDKQIQFNPVTCDIKNLDILIADHEKQRVKINQHNILLNKIEGLPEWVKWILSFYDIK